MKKLFGGIDFTWKKVIIFAIITAVYTALMAILPFTKDTSFRDIAIQFEWWIFFGVIIISNSKSPLDSALKCFVFFLISQPLIYLLQVPFSSQGWHIFSYYKYWFMWTIACLPMGFIGYYINKKNYLSMIILLPMLGFLAFLGTGYFTSTVENFPHHLLSCLFCIAFIIIIVLCLFDKTKIKIITLSIVLVATIIYVILHGGIIGSEYETYKVLDDYNINFVGKIEVTYFSGTAKGNVTVVDTAEGIHTVKVNGRKNGKYEFDVTDEAENEYHFEYHYDDNSKSIVLNRLDNNNYSFDAKVIEKRNEDTLLVEAIDDTESFKKGDNIIVHVYNNTIYEKDMTLKISFDGNINESYPPQISTNDIKIMNN